MYVPLLVHNNVNTIVPTMSLLGDLSNTESEVQKCQGDASYLTNSTVGDDRHLDMEKMEEDEEDEDIDFIPLLAAESPSEASSSLSSEDEISGETAKYNVENKNTESTPNRRNFENEYPEVFTNSKYFSGANEEALDIAKPYKKRHFVSKSAEVGATDPSKLYYQTDQPSTHAAIPTEKMRTENEDAIFRRTRARHSLANYTLEELETFLQESDDDDNSHNVDDEEEYRKFLTAVLRGGEKDGKDDQEDENIDEDEENDADFEIEIEEALESDVDENTETDRYAKRDLGSNGHVPETRQKKSQKNKKLPVNGSPIALRPLLPSAIDSQSVSFPSIGLQSTSFTNFQYSKPSLSSSWTSPVDLSLGFTTVQISQLYCLVHEHVQLLIQLYSLCILDPSWHHIAHSFRKMIIELAEKREGALSARRMAYPASCFDNLHVYLSERSACNQASDCCPCIPLVRNPIMSVLDVVALSLAREYVSDVSVAVSKYRSCQIDADSDKSYLIKQPLFPLPDCMSAIDTPDDGRERATFENGVHKLASQIKQKKSLAAELIENAKKQPIAQVPKGIADLAQRFLPIFNSAFFPRKPPSPAISKRIYFTESEDRLLAMGLLEYNNDWTAIQQRFLPCKSRHQIFVRQKNRSSAKAPENPIKTVRHMKTSPLTVNEMALISKGLKMFKNDWTAVWKFLVPHRDPSLLPRQWRIACGVQKSYKKSDIVKEKRRLYESKRRKLKSIENEQSALGKEVDDNSANDNINEDDEAHFNESFLVDPDPRSSKTAQTITGQTSIVPYQAYNNGAPKVIKLAPDLPPVNLPPSVRVISQSAFQNYHGVSLAAKADHGNCKFGNNLNDPKSVNGIPSNNCHRNVSVLDASSKTDHHSANGGHLGSDILMHALLFSPPGNGSVSDYANTCRTISKNQKEPPTNIETIDFHPILQRSEDDVSCSVFSNNNNISVPSAVPYEKENDIDLDIHLSSTMNKDKIRTSAGKADQLLGSRPRNLVVSEHGKTELQSGRVPSFTSMLDDSIISNKEYADGHTGMLLQEDSARIDRENSTSDAFLAEIVMEQEELSDSDDDIEHVEFEYEEMDDSEEELLHSEPAQNQYISTLHENGGDSGVKIDASKDNHGAGSLLGLNQACGGRSLQMVSGLSKSTSLKSKQKAGIRTLNEVPPVGVSCDLGQRKVHPIKGPKGRYSRVTKNSS